MMMKIAGIVLGIVTVRLLPPTSKPMAVPVLEHRIILNPSAQLRDLDASSVIAEVLAGTPVPGGAFEA